MSAPRENQFWKLRSKHGREKIFSKPGLLLQAAYEYFQWCDDNPWIEIDWVGKNAMEVKRKTARPYTLSGLCAFMGCDEDTFRNYSKKEEYKDFFEVTTRIEQIMRTQKFEGAAVGAFNANIIARDLGLKDASNHEITGKDGKDLFNPSEHNSEDLKTLVRILSKKNEA